MYDAITSMMLRHQGFISPHPPHDDAALQRKKLGINDPHPQRDPNAYGSFSGNGRRQDGGGLDSLGKGNVL